MASSFNPDEQLHRTESKIVVALERISEAFRVLLWNAGKENTLSPIQVQLLIFLLFHPEANCKVSYLAREFNMTKATISDSIKALLQKELVTKTEDPADTRSFAIALTRSGKTMARKLSSFAAAIEAPLGSMPEKQKESLLLTLLQLIARLNEDGIITVQRMCFNCRYYATNSKGHYCNFLQQPLTDAALRIDCPEHSAV